MSAITLTTASLPIDSDPVPDSTQRLTAVVHDIVGEIHPEVTPDIVEWIITEAMFQAGLEIRRGNAIELEYLGEFRLTDPHTIRFQADEQLWRPLSKETLHG